MIFPRTVYTSGNVKKDSVGAKMRERARAKQMAAALEGSQAAEPTSELVLAAPATMAEATTGTAD